VLILRDPHESVRKCSLTPLRGVEGIRFVDYRHDRRVWAGERTLLHPLGEELTPKDCARLLVIDCAWRRVDKLLATVDGELSARALPPLQTAYPRRSKSFADPSQGLASVEALYAALLLLGRDSPELLADYPFAEQFLRANPRLTTWLTRGG
jgi:pre-rRNA-processing protein TSR3